MVRKNIEIFEKFSFDSKVIKLIQDNSSAIAESWATYHVVENTLEKFEIEHDYFIKNIAKEVMGHFISVLKQESKPGDCPVMRRVIELFYSKGLNAEDVFIICTTFKNTLNRLFITNGVNANEINKILTTLDFNLREVLAIYTTKTKEKDDETP